MKRKSYASSLITLYVASGAMQASLSIAFITLPLYALAIKATELEIGLISAVGSLTYSLMATILGPLSDRFAKRDFLVMGAAIQAVTPVLYVSCDNQFQLIPVRIAQSLGLALFWPTIEALVSTKTKANTMEQALAGYNISWGAAGAFGAPLAGFLITAYSLLLPFYVSSAFAFAVAAILLTLPNDAGDDPPRAGEAKTALVTEKPRLVISSMPMAAAFIYAFTGGIAGTFFPVFSFQIGMPAYQMGLLFFISSVVQTVVFAFSGRLLQRLGERSFSTGFGALMVSLTLIAVTGGRLVLVSYLTLITSFIAFGLGQGILYSSSLYYLLRRTDGNRGHAAGMFESTLGLASFLGPLVGGAVAQFNTTFPFIAGAGISSLVLAAQIFSTRRVWSSP